MPPPVLLSNPQTPSLLPRVCQGLPHGVDVVQNQQPLSRAIRIAVVASMCSVRSIPSELRASICVPSQ